LKVSFLGAKTQQLFFNKKKLNLNNNNYNKFIIKKHSWDYDMRRRERGHGEPKLQARVYHGCPLLTMTNSRLIIIIMWLV
jgi:hypothetical protein